MDEHYKTLDKFISETEDSCGVRFSWNLLPFNRSDSNRTAIPMGCLFTPLWTTRSVIQLPYEPLKCSNYQCNAFINVYCQVDFHAHVWVCCFCQARNMLPTHYHQMKPENRCAELALTSVEYIQMANLRPSVFLFLVDTCLDSVEMASLREQIHMAIGLLPQNSHVGLISFSRVVYIHELSPQGVSRSYVFSGNKNYAKKQLQNFLGMEGFDSSRSSNIIPENKFIQQLEHCDATFGDLISDLYQDVWNVEEGKHALRATGAAMSVAISLLEILCPNVGGRIMLFTGGPCTVGPGQVCEDDLKKPIRTHHDISTDNCRFLKKAVKHYSAIADRTAQNGQTIDIFSCNVKETGIHEMADCANSTGGEIIMADSFDSELFSQNIRSLLQHNSNGDLQMGLNAAVSFKVSRDLIINGCIGHSKSHNQKDSTVSSNVIGNGNTTLWKVCGLTPRSTLAFYFDNENKRKEGSQGQAYFQFITNYQHPTGRRHIRVVTIARNWAGANESHLIPHYFDQHAGTVLMTRKGIWNAMCDYTFKISRYFDRTLINTCIQFGDYQQNNPSSYKFHPRFTMMPQFVFHLRRSQFSRTSNNSPDETSYNRHIFLNENVTNSLIMIQPVLKSYSYMQNNESLEFVVQNAPLDASSIRDDSVLLLDTFFCVLIYFGRAIGYYHDQQFHKQDQYAYLSQLFEVPLEDAKRILCGRFPVSRLIQTRHDGSQERFLLNKVNPSRTCRNDSETDYGPVLTDDVSLEGFIESIKTNVVNSG